MHPSTQHTCGVAFREKYNVYPLYTYIHTDTVPNYLHRIGDGQSGIRKRNITFLYVKHALTQPVPATPSVYMQVLQHI